MKYLLFISYDFSQYFEIQTTELHESVRSSNFLEFVISMESMFTWFKQIQPHPLSEYNELKCFLFTIIIWTKFKTTDYNFPKGNFSRADSSVITQSNSVRRRFVVIHDGPHKFYPSEYRTMARSIFNSMCIRQFWCAFI